MTTRTHRTYNDTSAEYLQRLYDLWKRGALSKVEIERKFFHDVTSQAKGITGAWRDILGVETEGKSAQSLRIEELEKFILDEAERTAKHLEGMEIVGFRGGADPHNIVPNPKIIAARVRAMAKQVVG